MTIENLTKLDVVAAGNFGSPMQLLILLAIVLLLFGGKRLRNLGSDIGGALKGFKSAMSSEDVTIEAIQHHQPTILSATDLSATELAATDLTATGLQRDRHKLGQ